MPRSLYTKLHRRFGPALRGSERVQKAEDTRRALMKWIPEAGATPRQAEPGRVIVVGAGFGGLSTAFWLSRYGFEVTVLEARDRVGGRVHSLTDFTPGRVIEAGGELIGLNHPLWLDFARRFGLGLSVVTPEDDYAGAGLEVPLRLQGSILPPETAERVYDEMTEAFEKAVEDARGINPYVPFTAPDAKKLDHLPLSDWIAGLDVSALTKVALAVLFSNENGEPPRRQSYLSILALIGGGGGMEYFTETEVFRCARGNQALATRLASEIGGDKIKMSCPVHEITIGDGSVSVKALDGTYSGDYVVLAVPPSTWPKIAIHPAFPPGTQMNMGPVVKYLSNVKARFWIREGRAPSGTSEDLGNTWEGTDNQMVTGDQGLELTSYAGGESASRALASDDPRAYFTREIGKVYPGYAQSLLTSLFVPWPRDPWTLGGFSAPLPGQVTTIGPFLNSAFQGRLFFAGEHACLAFHGFMEGALQSGLLAALRIGIAKGRFSAAVLPYDS